MHVNSLNAYYEQIKNFNNKEKLIYGHISMSSTPLTDREVKDEVYTISHDMNAVRPRISDLIKKGWLVEVHKVKDRVTGKNVRTVRAVSPEERYKLQTQAVQQSLL